MTKTFSFFHCVAVWRMSGGRYNWSEDDSGKAITVVQQVIKKARLRYNPGDEEEVTDLKILRENWLGLQLIVLELR